MNFDFKALLENKVVLYSVIGVVAAVLLLSIILGISASVSNNKGEGKNKPAAQKLDRPVELFTSDKIGQVLEVQALLARQGIRAKRTSDGGSKSTLVLDTKGGGCNDQGTCTMDDRDRALLALVGSGLVDEHMGLEIFDKGDFTSTKEDKRIRLVRAMNGELARLIRKIEGIDNAQVFISIPEQTFFASRQKPITATVQVAIPSGNKLDNIKIKAITNLLLGAVNDLKAENISITDTNGTTYNSIIDDSGDALSKIEENDRYMQNKVSSQLDRLVGKGNYVVTVSTFLTQSPVEKTSIIYDPESKTSVSEQGFTERLGDSSNDSNSATNAVSSYLPFGVPNSGASSSQDRSYQRNATETQYGVSKTQVNEYMKAGVIEEISVAVSLDQSSVPLSMSIQELKELIARAASPMVDPDNVSIAFVDSADAKLAGERGSELPKPEESGNPWWIVGLVLLIGLGLGLKHISQNVRKEAEKQEEEMHLLKKRAVEQEKQIQDMNLKAAELIQRQAQMAQNLIEQQNMQAIQQQQQSQVMTAPPPLDEHLSQTLSDLKMDFDDVDENEAVENLKSWIET